MFTHCIALGHIIQPKCLCVWGRGATLVWTLIITILGKTFLSNRFWYMFLLIQYSSPAPLPCQLGPPWMAFLLIPAPNHLKGKLGPHVNEVFAYTHPSPRGQLGPHLNNSMTTRSLCVCLSVCLLPVTTRYPYGYQKFTRGKKKAVETTPKCTSPNYIWPHDPDR